MGRCCFRTYQRSRRSREPFAMSPGSCLADSRTPNWLRKRVSHPCTCLSAFWARRADAQQSTLCRASSRHIMTVSSPPAYQNLCSSLRILSTLSQKPARQLMPPNQVQTRLYNLSASRRSCPPSRIIIGTPNFGHNGRACTAKRAGYSGHCNSSSCSSRCWRAGKATLPDGGPFCGLRA